MKKILILPILILLAVFTISLVSAAVASTMSGIVQGGNYTSVTITCTTASDDDDCTNCTRAQIWYDSAGATVDTILCAMWQTENNDTTFVSSENASCATNFEALTDGATYNWSCVFINGTWAEENYTINSTATFVTTVDNTDCSATATIEKTKIEYGRAFPWTTSITDVTSGVQTSSCQIEDPFGSYRGTITTSGTNVLFDDTTRIAGVYNLSCNATDYASNTCSASDLITVLEAGGVISVEKKAVEIPVVGDILEKLRSMDKKTLLIVIGVIILIGFAWSKKK